MGANSGSDETLPAPSSPPATSPPASSPPAPSSPGTDETLDARSDPHASDARADTPTPNSSGETLDASPASIEPVTRKKPPTISPDFTTLFEVDPTHYAVHDEVARGGMGKILAARDRRLGRNVAIKQLLDRDPQSIARFEREVRITARLQHPSIVHLHEAGRWPTGEPFFSMKLVAGEALDRSIAKAGSLQRRLELLPNVFAVVDALAYAHSEGVIHRDLKPGNVLVGDFGETVVIDWGLAKDLRAPDSVADSLKIGPYRQGSGETVAGSVMGTPAYMPPEQARGDRVDERADVYSLGALLYHVLAGAPPFDAATPQAVLARVLEGPPRPLAERDDDIPADLVAIVEKAMARDPAQRFANANEMAIELKRFQTGKLVRSHRYTKWELLRRWVRRNRAAVAVGTIAFATLAVLATIGIVKIVGEKDRADAAAAEALRRLDESIIERARADLETDPALALARLSQLHSNTVSWRDVRLIAADALSRGITVRTLEGETPDWLGFSHDGSQLASFERGRIRVWSTRTWQERTLAIAEEDFLDFAFAPSGLFWLTKAGELRKWDLVATKDTLVRSVPTDADLAVRAHNGGALSSDGRRFAVFKAFDDGVLVDLEGETRSIPRGYSAGIFDPRGAYLFAYNRNNERHVDRIDVATGDVVRILEGINVTGLATDGKRMWVGTVAMGKDSHFAVQEYLGAFSNDPADRMFVFGHTQTFQQASEFRVLPTGELISLNFPVSTRDDAVVVTPTTLNAQLRMLGHKASPVVVAASRDGLVASGDRDGQVRIWRLPKRVTERPPLLDDAVLRDVCGPRLKREKHVRTMDAAYLLPDRKHVVVVRRGPNVEVHELDGGMRVLARPEASTSRSCAIEEVGDYRFVEALVDGSATLSGHARSQDGQRLATLDARDTGTVVAWDLAQGKGKTLGVHKEAHSIAMHPRGIEVLTASDADESLVRWNVETGERRVVDGVSGNLHGVAYAPDGASYVVSGLRSVFSLSVSGAVVPKRANANAYVTHLVVSPDSRLVAGVMDLNDIMLWSVTADNIRTLRGHTGPITKLQFTTDGKHLVSSSEDTTVRIWDLSDGTHVVLRGHKKPATSFDFIDDNRLLTTSTDGSARVFDLTSHAGRGLGGHIVPVLLAYPTANGFVTLDRLGQITRHPDDLPHDEAGLRRWLADATTVKP